MKIWSECRFSRTIILITIILITIILITIILKVIILHKYIILQAELMKDWNEEERLINVLQKRKFSRCMNFSFPLQNITNVCTMMINLTGKDIFETRTTFCQFSWFPSQPS